MEQRMISMNSEQPDSSSYYPFYEFRRQDGFNTFMKHQSFFPGVVLEFSDSTNSAFHLRPLTEINISSFEDISLQRKWQEFVKKEDLDSRSPIINAVHNLNLRIFMQKFYL